MCPVRSEVGVRSLGAGVRGLWQDAKLLLGAGISGPHNHTASALNF